MTLFWSPFSVPGKNGTIIDLAAAMETAKTLAIKTVVTADLLALTLLEAPGNYGADVVVGTTQRFGIPLGYGGPHAAYFATKEEFKRNIPGRIIGQTRDLDGNPALRMALQTREQHIKRDRATSNICTAQVLLAVMAGMYAVYHGPKGLKAIADEIHTKAKRLEHCLNQLGIKQLNEYYFDTLHVEVDSAALKEIALKSEINLFYPDSQSALIALNEATTEEDFDSLVNVFETYANKTAANGYAASSRLPKEQLRASAFMTHPVFNSYHSESALMRYIKKN